jgi:uncharacterized protein (TIRG00374 family)
VERPDGMNKTTEVKTIVADLPAPMGWRWVDASNGFGAVRGGLRAFGSWCARRTHKIMLAVGLVLLVLLIGKMGLRAVLKELEFLGWMWLPFLALEFMGETIHAMGWRRCLPREFQRLPFLKIAMIRQAGMAFNYLTPTAQIGGELIRGTLLAREGRPDQAAAGVIVGKLAILTAKMVVVAVWSVLALSVVRMPRELWMGWLGGTALLVLAAGALCFAQRRGRLSQVSAILRKRRIGPIRADRFAETIERVDHELRDFQEQRPGDLVAAISWHFLGYSCGLLQVIAFMAAMGYPDLWQVAMAVWALGAWLDIMGFMIPAGIGVQEGSRTLVFHVLGLGDLSGLALGLAQRVAKSLCALTGLACYAWLLRSKADPAKAPSVLHHPQQGSLR